MHVLGVGNVAFRSMLESFGVVMVLLVRSSHGYVTHVLVSALSCFDESYSLDDW